MSIIFLNSVAGNLFRNLEMIWHDIKHYEMTWHQMIQKWYEMISNMLKWHDMKYNIKWYEMIPNIITWSFHRMIWQWSPLQVLMFCHCRIDVVGILSLKSRNFWSQFLEILQFAGGYFLRETSHDIPMFSLGEKKNLFGESKNMQLPGCRWRWCFFVLSCHQELGSGFEGFRCSAPISFGFRDSHPFWRTRRFLKWVRWNQPPKRESLLQL